MYVMCWNMQGAGTGSGTSNVSDALSFLHKGGDVLLLQEAGGYPDGWGLQQSSVGGVDLMVGWINIGSSRREHWAYVAWYDSSANTNAKHDRCSMAVICANTATEYGVITHNSNGLRPLVGVKTTGGLWCYSIHAPSGNHKAAAGVANSLIGKLGNTKYIVAGDYNCSPLDMSSKGHDVCSSLWATHQKGGVLDYAIYNKVTVNKADYKALGFPLLVSDHYSQFFSVT